MLAAMEAAGTSTLTLAMKVVIIRSDKTHAPDLSVNLIDDAGTFNCRHLALPVAATVITEGLQLQFAGRAWSCARDSAAPRTVEASWPVQKNWTGPCYGILPGSGSTSYYRSQW